MQWENHIWCTLRDGSLSADTAKQSEPRWVYDIIQTDQTKWSLKGKRGDLNWWKSSHCIDLCITGWAIRLDHYTCNKPINRRCCTVIVKRNVKLRQHLHWSLEMKIQVQRQPIVPPTTVFWLVNVLANQLFQLVHCLTIMLQILKHLNAVCQNTDVHSTSCERPQMLRQIFIVSENIYTGFPLYCP